MSKIKPYFFPIIDFYYRVKAFLAGKTIDNIEKLKPRYVELLCNEVFDTAFRKDPFGVICTVLRVGGEEDANWDPFEEITAAFDDLNWLRRVIRRRRPGKTDIRLALLMYCHAVEISAIHEILYNLLRIASGEGYHISPLGYLRKKTKKPFFSIPPSATAKFKALREKSISAGIPNLEKAIAAFFNDQVRNAFSHSNYVITDKYFRWREGGLGQQIEIEKLSELVEHCFAFYGAFLWSYARWKKDLGNARRYHKWPRYEVMEILSDLKHGGLYGFNVHFSNGNKSTFTRTKDGTEACNIMFEKDGGINFHVGLLDALTREWKIDGKPAGGAITEDPI